MLLLTHPLTRRERFNANSYANNHGELTSCAFCSSSVGIAKSSLSANAGTVKPVMATSDATDVLRKVILSVHDDDVVSAFSLRLCLSGVVDAVKAELGSHRRTATMLYKAVFMVIVIVVDLRDKQTDEGRT